MAQTSVQYADDQAAHPEALRGIEWSDVLRIGFVALCALGSLLELGRAFGQVDLVALAGVVIGGYPILVEAVSALASRRMTMPRT